MRKGVGAIEKEIKRVKRAVEDMQFDRRDYRDERDAREAEIEFLLAEREWRESETLQYSRRDLVTCGTCGGPAYAWLGSDGKRYIENHSDYSQGSDVLCYG